MSTAAAEHPREESAPVRGLGDTTRVDLVGGKAAALSEAVRAGLPVLPGFVLDTGFTARLDSGADPIAESERIRPAWDALSDGGERALVVRSSAPAEDSADASMAGRFESVAGVRGWDAFVAALDTVLASRADVGTAAAEPIALLVQPMLGVDSGGVLFGVDPVTGRSDRRIVAAVRGHPGPLVSGEESGTRYRLDPGGAVLGRPDGEDVLGPDRIRAVARLGDRVAELFGGPQDVEWGFDADGQLWLLQSRPVTVEVRGVPRGPVLGPGPVTETFPEPLAPLEVDLWVPPLRDALREALLITGARSGAEVEASPVAVVVDGQVALDLALVGAQRQRPAMWRRLDPRPAARRARAAWRVGRLRTALPRIAADVLVAADTELAGVPPLGTLTDRQLIALLTRAQQALRSLHAHELLVGQVVDPGAPRLTSMSVALRLLAHARADGLDDAAIVRRYPTVLALTAPRVRPHSPVPATPRQLPPWTPPRGTDPAALLREALRLRARWVQELTGRAAWELGSAWRPRGCSADPVTSGGSRWPM